MKKLSMALVVSLTGLTWADTAEVTLTTDKPVYRTGPSGGGVKFAIYNHAVQEVKVSISAPWSVRQGTQIVYTPPKTLNLFKELKPGTSVSFEWGKKGNNGKYVLAGSYTLRVWVVVAGKNQALLRTVALTPTGKLAGSSMFPLAVGNQWQYRGDSLTPGQPKLMTVTGSTVLNGSVWYKTSGFLVGGVESMTLVGKENPTLQVYHKWAKKVMDGFFFGRSQGYSQKAEVFGGGFGQPKSMTVGATNETVVTPAGTFKGCYRLDFEKVVPDAGYDKFWFAPGIGLVQYSALSPEKDLVYPLESVTIKGVDGKVYTVSAK